MPLQLLPLNHLGVCHNKPAVVSVSIKYWMLLPELFEVGLKLQQQR